MSSKATVKMKQKKEAQRLAALRKANQFTEEIDEPAIFEGMVTDVELDKVEEPIVEETVNETYTEDELNSMLKTDLINLAESLDLDSSGTKTELIKRILE